MDLDIEIAPNSEFAEARAVGSAASVELWRSGNLAESAEIVKMHWLRWLYKGI